MSNDQQEKRLIEQELPLEKIGQESRREKNIRHGHPSTMHYWWAPRPQAASRVAAYASLIQVPGSDEDLRDEIEFIKRLSTWEATTDERLLEQAEKRILQAFDGDPPRTLDPFAGRGILPLESQRLGCESHALELNPVAHIINKGLMEYPSQERRQARNVESDGNEIKLSEGSGAPILLKHLEEWAEWVEREAREEIGNLYSPDDLMYLWARTLPCQNPDCDLVIPLTRNRWVSERDNVLLEIQAETNGDLSLEIRTKDELTFFKDGRTKKARVKETDHVITPSSGTVQRGSVSCPACDTTFSSEKTRELSRDIGFGERLLAVVSDDGEDGKSYHLPTEANKAIEQTAKPLEELEDYWIPDEPLPPKGSLGIRVNLYEYETWDQLFNPRQRLALATFAKKVDEAYQKIAEEDENLAEAVATYLAFAVDKMANRNSRLSFWAKDRVIHTFTIQGLPIRWDYAETNPFGGWSGSWTYCLEWIKKGIDTCSNAMGETHTELGTATRLPYPDNHFEAVLTDPPYYDNIPYSSYSDYFYIWMKRSLRSAHPDIFRTPLSPKKQEIIQDKGRHDSEDDAEEFFERQLSEAFSEINRVLKEDGICTIVFAHKSTEAWAQMIRSLLASGLVVTATWPIHTERHKRPRSLESAALSSSIYFVCRKRTETATGYYSDVEEKLERRVHERLEHFWNQGIRGADLLVSGIGPAVEVFGQFREVKRLSGEPVTVDELLETAQRLVSDYALQKVLQEHITLGDIDPETRFYILYRWAFANQEEDFDEVRKLAQVNDADIERLEHLNLLDVTRGDAKIVAPQNRELSDPEEIPDSNDIPIVDKIQRAAILWEEGDRTTLNRFLEEHCMVDAFWRTAQAIAECLPEEEAESKKEKQMLHGLLGYSSQMDLESTGQVPLTDYTPGGDADD